MHPLSQLSLHRFDLLNPSLFNCFASELELAIALRGAVMRKAEKIERKRFSRLVLRTVSRGVAAESEQLGLLCMYGQTEVRKPLIEI